MRSLAPKEHGAYAQLAAPLVAAFSFGVTLSAVALAVAAVLAFLAHEPLLVILGHRGPRVKEAHGARAERRLGLLVPLATIAAIVGLALAPLQAFVLAGVVALPAIAFVVLAWLREERTIGGEMLAAVVLSGAAAPIAAAAGARWQIAVALWIAWSLGYAATVIAVHRVIARNRQTATLIDHVSAGVAIAFTIATLFAHAWPAVPLIATSAYLLVRPPPAKYLRTIGLALVAASSISVVLVVQLVR